MGGDEEEDERNGGEVVGVEGSRVGGTDRDAGVGGQSCREASGEGLGGPSGRGVEESRGRGAGRSSGGGGFAAETDGFVEEEEGRRGEEDEEGEVGGGGGACRRRGGRHRGGGACGRMPGSALGFWEVFEARLWALVSWAACPQSPISKIFKLTIFHFFKKLTIFP